MDQCGGRDVALETVQAVFDLLENDSQSEDDGSESNDDGDKSDEDGGESNESGASGHDESAVSPQLKRNTPRRATAKAAAGAIQARAVIRKKASNRASATRKKRTAKKANGRKKGWVSRCVRNQEGYWNSALVYAGCGRERRERAGSHD